MFRSKSAVKDLASAVDRHSSSKDIPYFYKKPSVHNPALNSKLTWNRRNPKRSWYQTHDWNITTRGRKRTEFTLVRTEDGLKEEKTDQMARDWAVAGGWILPYIRTTLLRDVTHGSTGNGSASATGFRPPRNLRLLFLTLKLTFLTLIITCFQIHLER
jgi:hypothetical protein